MDRGKGFYLLKPVLPLRRLVLLKPLSGTLDKITHLVPAELSVIIRDQGGEAAAEPVWHVRRGSVEDVPNNPFL